MRLTNVRVSSLPANFIHMDTQNPIPGEDVTTPAPTPAPEPQPEPAAPATE